MIFNRIYHAVLPERIIGQNHNNDHIRQSVIPCSGCQQLGVDQSVVIAHPARQDLSLLIYLVRFNIIDIRFHLGFQLFSVRYSFFLDVRIQPDPVTVRVHTRNIFLRNDLHLMNRAV